MGALVTAPGDGGARPWLSIVVPTLNEAAQLADALAALAPLRQRGVQVIVVDGASTDRSAAIARDLADVCIDAPRGRASQMNAGAALAQGQVVLFLHADTRLPPHADAQVEQALRSGGLWGRFDVCINGPHPMLAVVAAMMNLRSRLTGIATGDQALFVRREVWQRLGGFADLPLMEDIELSGRLRALARPVCLRQRVHTSGRRWLTHGVWRTVALMWCLRWRYWRGESAQRLAQLYK